MYGCIHCGTRSFYPDGQAFEFCGDDSIEVFFWVPTEDEMESMPA